MSTTPAEKVMLRYFNKVYDAPFKSLFGGTGTLGYDDAVASTAATFGTSEERVKDMLAGWPADWRERWFKQPYAGRRVAIRKHG